VLDNARVTSSKMEENRAAKKIVIIGDGACGKTSLLMVYTGGKFPTEYTPTVFEVTNKEVDFEGQTIEMRLWDTAGQEDYERLRILAYEGVDVVIMAFSMVNKNSFDNILDKWVPEYKQHLAGIPIVLVGTKKDILTNKNELENHKQGIVQSDDIRKMAKKISAFAVLECSAFTGDGVEEVFQAAIKAAVEGKGNNSGPLDCCVLS